jgi:D-lactate dehydrogenase
MRVAVFSTKPYDREFLEAANAAPDDAAEGDRGHELVFLEPRLSAETAALAEGADAVCLFVNDRVDAAAARRLAEQGVRLLALRCAGFNNVDLAAARDNGLTVARVPAYSPHAVAEHTLALVLALNRKIYRAYNRVREGNFALDGLLGFDLYGKTAGIVGTGQIGTVVARILAGFGCRILAYDPTPNPECEALGAQYVGLDDLFGDSDLVTLHCPLNPHTYHLVDAERLRHAKPGLMLINTGRGALIDTRAVVSALKQGTVGSLGLDVYEEEEALFFEDLSGRVLRDDVFARLLTFPNVLITGHQGFFTREALTNIAKTTIGNIDAFARTGTALHEVSVERIA